ncbi:AP-1 complex subunit mu, putative [Plasmodium knowlesi strain H]|uniref:AP-1 complex subunit mu, putative n=3 Tax=Plasmodium knowlesi TaxID=5850 RepID=A0A5K1V1D1_PLAKH|nr:AP-1 complex subunit mu-1, putative [Plasmodium knowlesi strain H]OTN63976.1 putative AP-1 complex subunit mu [Plasmodium knowlesi]CAA9990717.1 AP-1 complex subunit mu-1, putative [Plasmodium knowlesi strain H]SBO25874.1 AP-1 complex subunit mu, putative [Plasmodium knowlesi strain H]SBO28640.1 AP-1 complex subunit mu, putative [Plasmodium knowlesi strain H]VVS80191.1 AP-1 complex subunit mu-1, putative [Plasmodium knowlesi strain H]|eukprot:XP_002262007.1 clathrin-adaptor medium chain, putative [Plasmodium knowlesi strain H]
MACISAIFIIDMKGKVIINRNYRGEVNLNLTEVFYNCVIDQEDNLIKPIFHVNGLTYCWVAYNNIYILAVTRKNSNATLIITFLYKLIQVLKDYFKVLEEESIKDNFVITYELLDEMIDNGFPQLSEVKILREYIKNKAHQLTVKNIKIPSAITNSVSWRNEGIKYKKNEIFLDVIESLNIIISSNGTVLRSEILGCLKMKSYLSGMPELKLGLNDKLLFNKNVNNFSSTNSGGTGNAGSGVTNSNSSNVANVNTQTGRTKLVELEDMKFHQCVRLSKFENDRTISFIPPDGIFNLMTYRLSTHVKPLFWLDINISKKSLTKIEYVVKAKSQFKNKSIANNVEFHLPVPADVDSPHFQTYIGTVKYYPDKDILIWKIKQFQGQKEYIMNAQFGLPSIVSNENKDVYYKRPVNVKFEIPYFTVSGITVRYLKIIEKSGYQALPWVRYITQNGDYQVRIS